MCRRGTAFTLDVNGVGASPLLWGEVAAAPIIFFSLYICVLMAVAVTAAVTETVTAAVTVTVAATVLTVSLSLRQS